MTRTPPARRPSEVSSGAVVARQRDARWEYALVRARRHWGLPKGHLEAGETPEQAALREVSEETGLPVDSLSVHAQLPPSEYAYRDRDQRLVFKFVHQYLVVTTWGGELSRQVSEIDAAGWFGLDEAIRHASFSATRDALRAAAVLLGDGTP